MDFDVSPIIFNNRVLVSFRKIFESLGATVSWDEKNKTVKGSLNNTNITLKVGEDESTINNKKVLLDCSPQIIDGRVLVPLRFICESIGAKVEWYDLEKSVYIDTTNAKILNPAVVTDEIKELDGNSIGTYDSAIKGDYIYYINRIDGNKLYRIKKDLSENIKIYDSDCMHISLSDKHIIIYANNGYGQESTISRINYDGTGEEILDSGEFRYNGVYDNYLYYFKKKFIRINVDADIVEKEDLGYVYKIYTDSDTFIEDITPIILKNWIFKSRILRRFNILNLEEGACIIEDADTLGNAAGDILDIQDEWIYFRSSTDFNRLTKVKTDGTSETRLGDGSVVFSHYYDGYIYYYEYTYNVGKLLRVKSDGSMKQVLAVNNELNYSSCMSKIGVIDGCFYYIIDDKLYSISSDDLELKYFDLR